MSILEAKNKKAPGGNRIGYFPTGTGWYRKHFELSMDDQDKKVFIEFGGVFRNAEVWINGHSLGVRPYGYTTFQHDLTPYVEFGGANVMAVRVDNSNQPNSRWYTGSGIYRPVHLILTDQLHVPRVGITVQIREVVGQHPRRKRHFGCRFAALIDDLGAVRDGPESTDRHERDKCADGRGDQRLSQRESLVRPPPHA